MVFLVHPAHPAQAREFPARDQIEIVDQPGHGGVVAIRLARLQGNALAKAARADAGGVERLHQCQCGLGLGHGNAQFLGYFAQREREVARLVQPVDQCMGNRG